MAIPRPNPVLAFVLSLFVLRVTFVYPLSSFCPVDNYLIDCGSAADATLDVDGRCFTGDSSQSGAGCLSAARTISLRDQNPPLGSSPIYETARVLTRPSRYEFKIRDKGTHMVRLHFHRFDSVRYNLSGAQFHVSANGFLLLSNFTGQTTERPVIKEYMIWVDGEKLVISFTPTKISKIAFVNAIEVISAPKDLIADTAQFVDHEKVVRIDGLTKQALETVYRINVGGPKVTPFNDSLWRTWVPDDEFLVLRNGANRVYSSARIRYQVGGASREICPDNVYNSARVISSGNASVPNYNITWVFPVAEGYKYLVRTHFCDIASISLGLLYFNVYVNGYLAYENLDMSYLTNMVLASPFYADFVIDGDNLDVLTVSVGPSNSSFPYNIDAILNGVEIMKMNNSMGSLDGKLSAESVLKGCPRRNIGVLVPLVAAACLLLAASAVMQRRIRVKDSVGWSPLPVDISEIRLKSGSQK
ncbi:probable receptor-like protein kinase At5g24010 [Malania oleifera]|uniref:probable receptor-like protein kinase At5g24010 n=1 Tax=Malania oleifera TaxID=397392 RepID=UPI0025AEBBEA|nr:probable receptor-like protein kinase At5g24010 [Malania oleifera]